MEPDSTAAQYSLLYLQWAGNFDMGLLDPSALESEESGEFEAFEVQSDELESEWEDIE
jgi:hypothetical protein